MTKSHEKASIEPSHFSSPDGYGDCCPTADSENISGWDLLCEVEAFPDGEKRSVAGSIEG